MSDTIKKEFNAVSKQYDAQRRTLIPCFDVFYGTIIEQIENKNSLKVLDIGAGTGLLSAMILEKISDAEITLIDIAEEMLLQARNRFSGNEKIRYVVSDYTTYQFDQTFDVVVSSLSIHHLTHEAKVKLYKDVFEMLNDGGIFVNGDQFLGTTEMSEMRNQTWWQRSLELAGINSEELAGWKKRTAMDIPASVEDTLRWLRDTGFQNVDILFKQYNFGVIIGEKHGSY